MIYFGGFQTFFAGIPLSEI